MMGAGSPSLGSLNRHYARLAQVVALAERFLHEDPSGTLSRRCQLAGLPALALIDRAEAAILARAFRRQLVFHYPNDDTASDLLECMRACRAAKPARTRGRLTKQAQKFHA